MKLQLGRYIYGLAAIASSVITLLWKQIHSLGSLSSPLILVFIVGIVELIGGLAILWEKTIKYGALILSAVYLIFTLYLVPPIFEMPLAYYNWGNFFEEFSIVIGGVIIFASTIRNNPERAAKIEIAAYRCFGICVISYSLYQLFYLSYTANLVPTWLPPNQMFWAAATTIAFAVAAYAIISGRKSLLASRLVATMFIGFCLLVWFPVCFKNPFGITGWVSNAKTLAVAGSVWIVADFLSQQKIVPHWMTFNRVSIEQREITE